jgi:hypothetical protein
MTKVRFSAHRGVLGEPFAQVPLMASAILADANPGVHKSALATTPSRSIENCVRFKSRTELLALFLNFNIFPDLRYPASSIDVQR